MPPPGWRSEATTGSRPAVVRRSSPGVRGPEWPEGGDRRQVGQRVPAWAGSPGLDVAIGKHAQRVDGDGTRREVLDELVFLRAACVRSNPPAAGGAILDAIKALLGHSPVSEGHDCLAVGLVKGLL